MFFAQPGELSDDELDPDEEMEEERPRQSAHHDAAAESSSKTNSSSAVSKEKDSNTCLLYTSPSPRDKRQSRMPSSA